MLKCDDFGLTGTRQCGLSQHRWSVTNTARGPVCHETVSLTQERKINLQLLFLLLIQLLLLCRNMFVHYWLLFLLDSQNDVTCFCCPCVFKHFRLLGLSLPMGNVPAIVSAIETQWLSIVAGLSFTDKTACVVFYIQTKQQGRTSVHPLRRNEY